LFDEDRVLRLIEGSEKDLVAFTQKLVQIPSITGDEKAIGEFVAEKCRELGLDVEIFEAIEGRPNVIARYRGSTGKPCLLAYAHYDTVAPGDLQNWSHGPFSGAISENKIWGRGVGDHKYPITSFLYGLKSLLDAGVELKGDIVFIFVGDEERGGHKGFKPLLEKGYADDADFMIYSAGASEGKQIDIASDGRVIFQVLVKGKTAHTAFNEKGVNAILKAVELISRLKHLSDDVNNRRYLLPGTEVEMRARFSINVIHAEIGVNNVPDRCTLLIDRRTTALETFDMAESEIKNEIDQQKKVDPDFNAELSRQEDTWMPLSISPVDSEVVKAVQKAVNKVMGFTPEVGAIEGSSDHGWFNKIIKKPVAAYGIAFGVNAHGPDEALRITDLVNTTKVYALMMINLLGAE
jgi:acetylornithine deacetylase/succinyl-diaminopimelate desuccinylase family protein